MKIYLIMKSTPGMTDVLYAFTKDKKLADKFMNQRDENQFTLHSKKVTKEEYHEFAKDRGGINLWEASYDTEKDGVKSRVNLVVTHQEDMSIYTCENDIYRMLARHTHESSNFMNEELLKALHNLLYFFVRKEIMYLDGEWNIKESFIGFLDGLGSVPTPPFRFKFDELATFIKLYGNTLKKNKKEK